MIPTLSLFEIKPPPELTDSDQRYTKPDLVAKYDRILGGIGLDPTSNPQKSVKALHHITERENCFTTDWTPFLSELPTVFMNPPYSCSHLFLDRMAQYLRNGTIDAAITLTLSGVLSNKRTQPIIQELAIATCHPFGRVQFIGSGNRNDRDVVSILWGKGANLELFHRELEGLKTTINGEF